MGDIRGTNFVDINGDHTSDWVWLDDDDGSTSIYTNTRGRYDGLSPLWKKATRSHAGIGQSNAREKIRFPKLFVPEPGQDGGSHSDYVRIRVEKDGAGSELYSHYFDVWQNEGTGGTRMKADGNRYCDMTGDGR